MVALQCYCFSAVQQSESAICVHISLLFWIFIPFRSGFPGSDVKEFACNEGATGDPGSIPGSGRALGEGTGNPLQYSCLENSMDRGAWRATVHGVAKSQTRLSKQH